MGLDSLERGIGFVAGALAMVLALIISPRLFKNTTITTTSKLLRNKTCAATFHLVNGQCEKAVVTHWSYWLPQFLEVTILGIGVIYFTWRRKRAGVAVTTLLIGLAFGTVGLPFLLVGGWLIVRAFRLQKYGDATFSGSSRIARETAKSKRGGRSTSSAKVRSGSSSKGAATSSTPSSPEASKRYTPKKQQRRR
jgi:hypothetical protein